MDVFDSMCGVPIIAPILNGFVPSAVIMGKVLEISRKLKIPMDEVSLKMRFDRLNGAIDLAITNGRAKILAWEKEKADYQQLASIDTYIRTLIAEYKRALYIERRQWIEAEEDKEAGVLPLKERPMSEFVVEDVVEDGPPKKKKSRVMTLASLMAAAGKDPLMAVDPVS